MTPFPYRGVKMASVVEWRVSGLDVQVEQELALPDVDGDILVAGARAVGGGQVIVAVDLNTGQARRLSAVTDRISSEPHISGRYVAWTEEVEGTGREEMRLFDLEANCGGAPNSPMDARPRFDIRGGLMAWRGTVDSVLGLYATDLEQHQRFTIDASPGSLDPRVCSKEWVVFLRNIQQGTPSGGAGDAELVAHNLTTGEQFLIGHVPYPATASAGKHHACDGRQVAWVEVAATTEQQASPFRVNLFDLSTRANRVIPLPSGASYLPSVEIEGDVLRAGAMIDLKTDAPVNAAFDLPQAVRGSGGYSMLSSERITVVAGGLFGTSQSIYTARIERQP